MGKEMDIIELVEKLDFESYQRLKTAVELGKWPDGNPLSAEQKDNAMQLVIAYQATHLDQQQHMSVAKDGSLNTLSKAELKQQFKGQTAESIVRFKHDDI
ncbi:YeaC family protein [Corallincola platygyrae]|uniref:YeaC family protein n=1 Tax=Corallincola platygyrae TaxID=1193278 RepID=A0ABW4XG28_9GAMM